VAETKAVTLGGIGAGVWGDYVRKRKGGDRGDARLKYQQRREERKRKGKWRPTALTFMAGGYAGVKEREEGRKTARN
jgi:hypothetical protein